MKQNKTQSKLTIFGSVLLGMAHLSVLLDFCDLIGIKVDLHSVFWTRLIRGFYYYTLDAKKLNAHL